MRTFVRALVVVGSVALAAATQGAARADSPDDSPAGAPTAPTRQVPTRRPPTPARAEQPPAPAPAMQRAASEKNGLVQIVDEALSGIQLKPEQKAELEKMGKDADAKVAAVDEAKREFLLALAAQIEGDGVDASKLQPEEKKFVTAADAASPVLRSDFEKIHAILDKDQRKEFDDAFRAALKKRAAMIDPKKNLDDWATTLKLNDDQKQKIAAILDTEAPMDEAAKGRVDRVLDAFPEDKFSLDELLPGMPVKDRSQQILSVIIDQANRISQVLTPEQRTLAASKIRERVTGGATTGTTTAAESIDDEEEVGSSAQALWAGSAGGFRTTSAVGYHRSSGYGFSRGYATGFGGTYLL